MLNRQLGKAFTLIELLVVVAIIALLISILLPTLKRAKDQAKKAVCLSQLRDIGTASHEYATEDDHNRIMPISAIMVRAHGYWYKRCVMWYSWGGRGATDPFRTEGADLIINETNARPYYGTRRRPLTVYLYPDIEAGVPDPSDPQSYLPSNAPVFECPADVGYPDVPEGVMDDAPEENAGNRMFDTVGSSYRGSLANFGSPGGAKAFSIGIWGQRLDRLTNTSELLWGGDPLFYGFIGTDSGGGWPEVKKQGWHGEIMVSNELFADAHAAPTQAVSDDDLTWKPSGADIEIWGIDPALADNMHRGPGWQIYSYPTPGVAISGYTPLPSAPMHLWPWKGYTTCPKPPR
ncbi:MAG: type II secretion system protein [Phycisphaerae bacterium]